MEALNIKHLDDEELTEAYYGELEASGHLAVCGECRERLERLREVLDAFDEYPIPERQAGYGSAVWASLLPKLPAERARGWWLRWWTLTPVVAALLTIAFVTGRLSERHSDIRGISEKARERVLLISMSEHLEQAQIVLANVANAGAEGASLADERDRAHELLGANRLLRQTAERLGDYTDAALLDELERVLLEVADSAARTPVEQERIQEQIEQEGLLFRVRVTSTASRARGQKL